MEKELKFKVVEHEIRGIEDCRTPVWGADFNVTQLRSGDRCYGGISHAFLGKAVFSFGDLGCTGPVRVRGDLAPKTLYVALPRSTLWRRSSPATGSPVVVTACGSELDTVLAAGSFRYSSISFPALEACAFTETLCPDLPPFFETSAAWRPPPDRWWWLAATSYFAEQTVKQFWQNPHLPFNADAFGLSLMEQFISILEPRYYAGSPDFTHSMSIVRKMEDLLRSEEPPVTSMAELCVRLGISRRSLERAFRHFLDISPLQYVIQFRLCRAREDLLCGAGSVTDIATKHGFYELGRFAMRYKRMFGEFPSETRKKGFVPLPHRR